MAAARSPVKTETQVSAGGAVLRKSANGFEVALISVGSPPRWQLPKGREVREEAGIVATPAQLIEKVEYWYQAARGNQRIRYHKFVNFFLMWYESGDVAHHDNEVNEARWFDASHAIDALAFRSERNIVERALQIANA
jgi:hypothetical protein